MKDQPISSPEDKLDAYAATLERRLRQMRSSGHLTRTYGALDSAIEERRRMLRNRVAEAIRAGRFWDIVKAELARDYGSLFDNVLNFGRDIDRNFEAHSARKPTLATDREKYGIEPASEPSPDASGRH